MAQKSNQSTKKGLRVSQQNTLAFNPIEERIRNYLEQRCDLSTYVIEDERGKLSRDELLNIFKVGSTRLSRVAVEVLPLCNKSKIVWAFDGEEYVDAGYIQRVYGVKRPHLSKLVEFSGLRRISVRTRFRPLNGEYYYHHTGFRLIARSAPRRVAITKAIKNAGIDKVARKPVDLSHEEYCLWLLLYSRAVSGKKWPSLDEITSCLANTCCDASVRLWRSNLQDKGYIQSRNKACRPHEYRFLKGPEVLMKNLARHRPGLVVPFE